MLNGRQMNTEAFPCASKYIEGSAKMRKAASHHGIMQANERRAPARQPKTTAVMQQTDRQAKPDHNGQLRTQNRACAPSGLRKYPYVRPADGTSIVNAFLCHNQIKRIVTIAARNGRIVFARRNKTRLSQAAVRNSATHHPTRRKGTALIPYRPPISIVPGVAQAATTTETTVESATWIVAGFSGSAIKGGSST